MSAPKLVSTFTGALAEDTNNNFVCFLAAQWVAEALFAQLASDGQGARQPLRARPSERS